MDEHNDKVEASQAMPGASLDGATNGHSDLPISSDQAPKGLVPLEKLNGKELIDASERDGSASVEPDKRVVIFQTPTIIKTTSGKLVAQNYALHRTRINRMIM